MPNVLPLSARLERYLKRHNLTRIWEKQLAFFRSNPFHPSLHTELLEPRYLRIYSFRLTRSYRAIFVYRGGDEVEIIDINNHYR